ncbi:hypothetical protein A8990_1332 [Paenibacillus taihuensis]|uniref:Alcohol dehydrogenase-like protein n=1 Tax=Paenibacillus taihuensis TaxID=1156355 RepID=A0A3D9QVV8_9BACL|nr:hypothetical protein [Paenibacillus taihuensis]REE69537.1 hypothetical protein A8990_1332 [Paenibacillus taihuensis]
MKIVTYTVPKTMVVESNDLWQYSIRSCDPGVWYMGCSNVGHVVEIGSAVTELAAGDLVYSSGPHQSHLVRPERDFIQLPDTVKPEQAIFFTNLMTTYNGMKSEREGRIR